MITVILVCSFLVSCKGFVMYSEIAFLVTAYCIGVLKKTTKLEIKLRLIRQYAPRICAVFIA